MLSASCASDLAAWLVERVATKRIAALWMLLAAAAWSVSPTTPLWIVAAPMALLVVQFRLWDDLAEREHDAARHPGRVMVRTAHAACFAMVVAVLAVVVAVLLVMCGGSSAFVIYGVLLAAAVLFYKKSAVAIRHCWRAYVVLLKYPVFVFLCAGSAAPLRTAATAVAVFGVLAAFEALDDATLHSASGRRGWTAAFVLLAVAGVVTTVIS